MATVLMASAVSGPTPQEGQKHRSSGDFSTDSMPSGTVAWKWAVTNHPNPNAVRFDVKHDISAGIDTTWFEDVYDGKQTTNDMKKERTLYIANPSGAGDDSFTVEVYAVTA
jgi:hypothetical protein